MLRETSHLQLQHCLRSESTALTIIDGITALGVLGCPWAETILTKRFLTGLCDESVVFQGIISQCFVALNSKNFHLLFSLNFLICPCAKTLKVVPELALQWLLLN